MTRRRNPKKRPAESRVLHPQPVDREGQSTPGATGLPTVALCFWLSGFAALLYQTAWLRQFSFVFGTSELAVAAVLAAYMGGLAVGAAVMRRLIHRVRRLVFTYGVLEAGIAISALLVPLLLAGAGNLYGFMLGGQQGLPSSASIGQPLYFLIATFLIIAVPTGLMGATLPLLTRHAVRSDSEVGPRVALLYAINTLGAVCGTITAAFLLLPELGLRGTVFVGVAINLLIFLSVKRLAPKIDSADIRATYFESRADSTPSIDDTSTRPMAHPAWVLPAIAISGAVSFCYEVLWTRLLSHVVGGSVYAFAIMLSAFLIGIALGSAAGGYFASQRYRAAQCFVIAQFCIGLMAAVAYAWMDIGVPDQRSMWVFSIYAVTVMLPATVFIGATFPLAVRVLAPTEALASEATASVYAWNTAGAIVGSIATGFVLLPVLGFESTNKLAVVGNFCIGFGVFLLLVFPAVRKRRVSIAGLLGVFVLAGAVLYQPLRPEAVLSNTAFPVLSGPNSQEVYYGVGRSATVLVNDSNGSLDIRTNGLPEATVARKGAPIIGQVQHWLTGLPIAAHPDARSLLVVGFGGGIALENVPQTIASIDVIELEPEVIAANQAIADLRAIDPLADTRINVVINDARNALRLSESTYDIIVSQPSHPWTAGASHLYTQEFVELAKAHLENDGVFLQWVGAGFLDESLLRGLAKNLTQTFAHVRLYQAGGSMLFLVASDAPLDIERNMLATGKPLSTNILHYSYMGLNHVSDMLASLVLDQQGVLALAEGGREITDDLNRMATHSRYLADGYNTIDLVESLSQYDPLTEHSGWAGRMLAEEVSSIAVGAKLVRDGFLTRADRLADSLAEPGSALFIKALVAGAKGDTSAALTAFRDSLNAEPTLQAARYALVEPRLADLAAGRADPSTVAVASGLSGSAAAVVLGWELAAKGRLSELARLDPELANANPYDLWYPEAVQLRADWRTQANGDERYAFDALRLIDRALLIRPKLELLLLRARAADVLRDNAAFVETARSFSQFVQARFEAGGNQLSNAEIGSMERQIVGIRAKLDGFGQNVAHAAEVAEALTANLSQLRQIRPLR